MAHRKTRRKLLLIILACLLGAIVLLVGGFTAWLITFEDPYHQITADADITEKQIQINDVSFHYAEGPDNGPALLLLHAQHLDWFSYSRVLAELSQTFHVFAVDYPGHGKTEVPDTYTMSANQIGADLTAFIAQVIGERTYVSGNSSGGLLTAWLAANSPEWVGAIVLEDPPLFSAEYPRVTETVAYKSFTTAYNCVQAGQSNFLSFFLSENQAFFAKYAGKLALPVIRYSIWSIRTAHPESDLELAFVQGSVRMILRGMELYNPRFGAAFYDGSWNEGFDHADALSRITCPALLIQADFGETDDGLLDGAMSAEEAQKALSLLQNGEYVKVDAGHVTHLEAPDTYIQLLNDFFLGQ